MGDTSTFYGGAEHKTSVALLMRRGTRWRFLENFQFLQKNMCDIVHRTIKPN